MLFSVKLGRQFCPDNSWQNSYRHVLNIILEMNIKGDKNELSLKDLLVFLSFSIKYKRIFF